MKTNFSKWRLNVDLIKMPITCPFSTDPDDTCIKIHGS